MPRKMLVSVVVLCGLLALLVTINTGNAAKSAGVSNPAALPGPAQTNGIETPDDRLAEVGKQVPGFGGMFFDQDGTLQVYMVNQKGPVSDALMASLDEIITREIGGGERLSSKGIEVLEGQYSFLDLHSWHQQMSPTVLSIPGVISTDNDDGENRLRVGITDAPGVAEAVEKQLSELGIPREAVVISEAKEVWPELRGRRRPLRGGLQINFGNFLCTLGFVAVRQGITGFVTNSHCTNTQGGVEGTVYHQPSASGTTNRIGQEIADPTYFTGGSCPAGRRCRFSDTSFARVPHPSGPAVTTALGTIARPAVNSFTWNGVDTFTITAEAAPVVGQAVTKVGRTTGRTTGTIQQTCANFNVSGSTITQLCQSRASFASAGGDSGSPVFRITALPNVTLVGIHWGSGGVFSPITGIQMAGELGAVTTCAGGGC
ncbi:MAG TPA: hypothetical protein VJ810_20430 [Blastocatellia bacterium]|nr:hypothetical protein [Blastocatellia bacterium]